MLPILLVISFVAPHAWSTQTTTPVVAAPVARAAVPAEAVLPEQGTTSTAAQEAERAKAAREAARQRELEKVTEEVQRAVQAVREVEKATQERPAREVRRNLETQERAREAALAREVAEVRRVIEASKEAQKTTQEVARRRLQEAQQANDLALLESQLRVADAALTRQKELVEKGLATRQSLIAAEEELNQLRLQLERAKVLRMTMQDRELTQDLEARKRQIQELEERGLIAHRNLPALEASATLQPEDRLTITIEGEPDLPKTFTVRADGSIRFPFLGSIRVQGSTTSQVQSAIQKLISDKGLARNAAVTVSAWRLR